MATRTWNGGGGDDNWTTAANWDVVPVAGDDLVFAGTTRLTPNNDFAADTSFNSITFSNTAGAFVIGGNRITLAGNVTNNDTDLQTINLDMIMAATRTFNCASDGITVGGVLSGAGGLTKTGTGTLTLSGANTYTGATAIQAGAISINTIQNVSGGASSLGAPTTVANGTIALGSTTTAGTLVYTGSGHSTNRVINLAGTTGGGGITQSGSGTLTFSSSFTATGSGAKTLTLDGSTSSGGVISGVIVDSGGGATAVTKTGTGTWTLSGTNTYTGNVTVNAGILSIPGDRGLGAVPGSFATNRITLDGGTLQCTAIITLNANRGITVGSGGGTFSGSGVASFNYNGRFTGSGQTMNIAVDTTLANSTGTATNVNFSITGRLFVSSSNAIGTGTITVVSGILSNANGSSLSSITNSVTIQSGGGLTSRRAAGTTFTNVTFPGSGTVTMNNDDAVTTALTVSSGASLSGTLTVQTGGTNPTVGLVTFSGVFSGSGGITKTQGTGTLVLSATNTYTGATTVSAGTLRAGASTTCFGNNSAVTVADVSGARLDLNTFSVSIGSLACPGSNGTVDTVAGGTPTLTVGGDGTSTTFAGVITDTAGTLAITKTGAGVLTLSGANTYAGTTTISAGEIRTQGSAFSTTPRTWSIGASGVLELNGTTGVATGTTTISGTGTLRVTGGTWSNTGGAGRVVDIALGSGATIDIQVGATLSNGTNTAFTWGSNLATLNVDGTFDLDGANANAGALTGSGSVVKLTTGSHTLTLGTGTGTFSGAISNASGTLNLTKSGTGIQTLSGTNTYTGATTVSAGTLRVTGSLAAGSAVAVNSGATLEGSGTVAGTVAINAGGTLSPGTGGTTINTLNVGATTFNATSTYSVNLDGTGPTADRITSTGAVACAGTLTIASIANSTIGKVYTIASGSSVTGTFAGLPNGAHFLAGGRLLRITYSATTVTLTDAPSPSNMMPVILLPF